MRINTNDCNSNALLSPTEHALVDQRSIDAGVSGKQLMDAAGNAVSAEVQRRWPQSSVLVLCGPGNNGGDGFVAARMLAEQGCRVHLALLGNVENLHGDAAYHASLWDGPIEAFSIELLRDNSVVIDAIFGAGLSRPLDGDALSMIEAVSAADVGVCAVDIPSGVHGATGETLGAAVEADVTVTFARKKPGHVLQPGRSLCGDIVVNDIGTPNDVLAKHMARTWENAPQCWLDNYPWPASRGNKFDRGSALVFGGAELTGASRLTSLSALRIGAGLVSVAVPNAAFPIYASSLTSVMVRSLSNNIAEDFAALASDTRISAIAIGPGAGVSNDTKQMVLAALASQHETDSRAVVLDADALSSFVDEPQELFDAIVGPCVITPHEGEFTRLFSSTGDRLARARDAASICGAVVILKGSDTVIAHPDGRAIINSNAPAELATAGAGDVLAGFVTGLVTQGMDAFDAACAAVWIHGDVASRVGPGLIADDLPNELPKTLSWLKHKLKHN